MLRIYEWGIVEDDSAGDQEDNSEETLRRWRFERCHTLFRLLCMHRDAGRNDAADDAYNELKSVEVSTSEDLNPAPFTADLSPPLSFTADLSPPLSFTGGDRGRGRRACRHSASRPWQG